MIGMGPQKAIGPDFAIGPGQGPSISKDFGGGGLPPVSDWIMAAGAWNDGGFWRDDQVWAE